MPVKGSTAILGTAMLGLLLSGCRWKGYESFSSATTPHPPVGTWKGDPYASGGSADATGGVNAKTTYGKGARSGPGVVANPNYDQPAKGTGLQPGENNGKAKEGHANSNAPALQDQPGEYSPNAARVKQ